MVNYVGDREGKNFLVRDNMRGRWRGERIVFSEHVVTVLL